MKLPNLAGQRVLYLCGRVGEVAGHSGEIGTVMGRKTIESLTIERDGAVSRAWIEVYVLRFPNGDRAYARESEISPGE